MENFITGYPGREFQIREALLDVLGKENYDIFFESVRSSFEFNLMKVPDQLFYGEGCQVSARLRHECTPDSVQLQPFPA
jgi:hypothetical protein